MPKIPRWLKIVLVVFVVLLVVALVVPYFLDVNRYRGTIVAAIEKETGRTAEIGPIRARLIPSVGFVIEGFKLSNPPNFVKGNLLEVEAIHGSLHSDRRVDRALGRALATRSGARVGLHRPRARVDECDFRRGVVGRGVVQHARRACVPARVVVLDDLSTHRAVDGDVLLAAATHR